MSLQSVDRVVFELGVNRPVVMEVSQAALSSDAGLLPVRQFDEQLRFTERFAAALEDRRSDDVDHSRLSMVRQRIYGILAGYEDQNDHDALRSDPIFKLIADRLPTDPSLASQPTLSRFENAVTIPDLWRLRDVLADQFLESFREPPLRITLDADAVDDPTHGHQQLTMFHGFYDQHQYLPVVITCAETDHVALVGLRHGTAHPALGVDDDLRYLVGRIRERWPDVEIHVRGDCGCGVPWMYDVCEELRVTYTFGLAMNRRLQAASEELQGQALVDYAETGQPQRQFLDLWYQAESWPCERFVVIKVEAHAQGTNRRAVVSNRLGAAQCPAAVYDAYTERGESENRNKELKDGLCADRLSDHRFVANFFRLYLHAAALNLLVRLRRHIRAELTPSDLGMHDERPAAALPEPERKRFFNRRRTADPLGEGHACTWQTRLFKVAAEVYVTARRVVVRVSSHWPYLSDLIAVSGQTGATLEASGFG